MDLATLTGTFGAALVLLAYALAEFSIWKEEGVAFDAANAVGSALLIAYAILLNSIPFLVLNAAWFLLSLRDLVRDARRASDAGEGRHDKIDA